MSTPAPGTTRYLCPLECGWHYDVPPPSLADVAGVSPSLKAHDLRDVIGSITSQAAERTAGRTETTLREHLSTHTPEQFVRTIHGLRAELALLRGAAS
ncbi:hypothetical protein ACODT3_10760 [Streptomyces sp. 4.24]|uniref:hypothetical protein n=1 Tax=Streptomyces tritrimontium TaxID=3406573 RepID=UPI003BB596F5